MRAPVDREREYLHKQGETPAYAGETLGFDFICLGERQGSQPTR